MVEGKGEFGGIVGMRMERREMVGDGGGGKCISIINSSKHAVPFMRRMCLFPLVIIEREP